MGLLDGVLGKVTGGGAGNITEIIKIADAFGGIDGIVKLLTKGGFGNIVESWIGNGSNLPISQSQISSALGSTALKSAASSIGIDANTITSTLSKYLPDVVNKLSPDGVLPKKFDTQSLLSAGLGFLK
ncbi:MAG: YidB family protein [Campylobacteraceae bacterium]